MSQIIYKQEFETLIYATDEKYILIEQPCGIGDDVQIVQISLNQARRMLSDIAELMELIED